MAIPAFYNRKQDMFGKSLHLDMYGCINGDNMEVCYRYLESMVERIGMTAMAPPFVIHGPTKNGVELYPDKAGLSAFIPLIESGITFHSVANGFISIDVYTCGVLNVEEVIKYTTETYDPISIESHVLERGIRYGSLTLD